MKGMIMMAVAVIGLILFFILDEHNAKYVNDAIESFMLMTMITTSIWAYYSVFKLEINPNPISFLDDLLLLICLPSFFAYCLLCCISGVGGNDLESTIPTNVLTVSII